MGVRWNRARITAIAVAVLLRSTGAVACPPTASVDFPPVCVDQATTASARICFGDACALPGIVNGVDAPAPPFHVTGYHLDGIGDPQPVSPSDFPVALLPGQSLVADLQVALGAPGPVEGQLAWRVMELEESTCPVALRAQVPLCAADDPSTPCLGAETCSLGVCVPTPVSGECDDGDPCTIDDICADGSCVSGRARDCDDGIACTVDRCESGRGCVHEPVDSLCGAGEACTASVCDPTAGCRATPLTGPACDDGETCTTDDACIAGRCVGKAVGCDDHVACTQDSCVGGACIHTPVDARCDRGQCVVAACRPEDAGADGDGCVATPVDEDTACTDDGVACTDDVCTGGLCLHVPVDSRCGSGDACVQAACAPDSVMQDASGCAISMQSGGCTEDGDACSDDVCQDGRCLHQPVAEWLTCSPVQPVFRKALALAAAAHGLNAQFGTASSATTGKSLAADLGRVAAELDLAVQVLAGKSDEIPPLTPSSPLAATPAQLRARAALRHVLLAPHQLRRVVQALGALRVRLTVGRDVARVVRRRGRVLLRGAKSLKRDLKRLQLVSQTFTR